MSFKWWKHVLVDFKTWQSLAVSFFIAISVVLINLLLCIPAANAIGRREFKGKLFFEAILFAPIIVPGFISTMGIHFTFIKIGLTETLLGVILVHIIPTLPYMMRALIVSFSTLSDDYENLGTVFGANTIQKYRYIIIPHILPAIISGSSLTLLISFSNYVLTLIIGGGQILTVPILMFPFISGGNRAMGSVYVIIFIVINIASLLLMEKTLRVIYKKPVDLME
jgi:putative spermidine/putrescine transport system permease protein